MTAGWDHDSWVRAWGRNATLIANADYRLPTTPEGTVLLALRDLADGRPMVELVLLDVTTGKGFPDRCRVSPGEVENAAREFLDAALSDPAPPTTTLPGWMDTLVELDAALAELARLRIEVTHLQGRVAALSGDRDTWRARTEGAR